MRILSFIVRVVTENDNVNADNVADEINEIIRENLPNGSNVDNCLAVTKLICNTSIRYEDGV